MFRLKKSKNTTFVIGLLKGLPSSETSITIYQSTRLKKLEVLNLQQLGVRITNLESKLHFLVLGIILCSLEGELPDT
jgi:hypothetical protein